METAVRDLTRLYTSPLRNRQHVVLSLLVVGAMLPLFAFTVTTLIFLALAIAFCFSATFLMLYLINTFATMVALFSRRLLADVIQRSIEVAWWDSQQ